MDIDNGQGTKMPTQAVAVAPPPAAMPTSPNDPAASPSTHSYGTRPSNKATTTSPEDGKMSAFDQKWFSSFNKLKSIIRPDGSLDYSALDDESQKSMRNFVKVQRKSFRKREADEPSPMTDERYKMLVDAKFNFKPLGGSSSKLGDTKPKAKKQKVVEEAERPNMPFSMPPTLGVGDQSTPMKVDMLDEKKPAKEPAKKTTPKPSPKPEGAPSTKKKNRSPTTTSTSRKSSKSGKPTYLEMVHEAIVSLKDRTGSSTIAISKWIQSNYDHTKPVQANMFKSRINLAIKTGVKDGRFAKIKNSYKINSEWTKKQKAAQRSKEAARKKQEKKREALMAKAEEVRKEKAKEKALTPEERVILKKKAEQEERKKKIEALKKKRRFPMEDTLLHNQEKEWGERPPAHVTKRPALPYTMTSLVPPNLRANMPKKYHGREHSASASGEGPLMGGENERGLITDAMSVWNFFCGDVGLVETQHPIPKFSFKTLLYALDEVLSGNAKTAKALPPLITHLFVTALKMLTGPRVDSSGNTIEAVDSGPAEARLLKDIAELNKGLNAISWSQVCFYYMDLMDQFFSSDTLSLTSHATAYLGERVLKPTGSLDMSYLWNEESSDVDNVEDDNSGRGNGYLGSEVSTLHKAFTKLENQTEPWSLKADELMSILRALCDDILIRRPELADDIAGRGAKLHELSKAKRAAMVKYNKVRVALEGPKKSTNLKKGSDGEETKEEEEESKPFVPTATKQQLDAACKALIRAEDAYDNGVTKLISQTEPVAFDRNFNAVYFFRSDPTMLHFELLKQHSTPKEVKNIGDAHVLAPQSTWHVIDTKPLFEQFLSSLDKRGKRENDLLEHLNEGLGRKLQDDKQENSRSVGRERERQGLLRRIENARSACDGDDGRRSGRLANNAMEELETLEGELKLQTQAHEEEERQEKLGREAASDYNNLTGLNKVAELFSGQRKTRSIRKKTDCVKDSLPTLADVPPHKLWMDKSIGGNGTLHILAGALLELETKANELAPWSREDKTRDKWRSDLTTAVNCWTVECEMKLGPNEAPQTQQNIGVAAEDTNPYKKQRTEAPGAMTTTVILNTLKTCLKDLELRVFEISGNKRAIAERAKAAVYEDDSSEEENVVEGNDSWKIKINALRRVPTHRYGLIRDIIVAAMTVARRSHLSDVARELKTVLQLVRPQAAGMAKNAAIEVLDNHGGYEDDDEDDDNINIEQFAVIAKKLNSKKDQDENVEHSSMLNDEVRIFSGCLGADLSVDSSDWTDAVKETRSISRLALMIQCFLANANETLVHLTQDRKSLDSVLGINARRTSRNKKSYVAKSYDTSTPVWANCTVTDKLVRAKVKGFPWWAASVAEPVDSLVADGLAASKHKLIVSVGSPGMFLVADKNIVDFAEETEDDITQYDKDIVEGMQDSLNIAKKLWRSRHKGMKSPWKKSKPTFPFEEEKKSDI